jgi:hypothetical protein
VDVEKVRSNRVCSLISYLQEQPSHTTRSTLDRMYYAWEGT